MQPHHRMNLTSPVSVQSLLNPLMSFEREEFWVLALNTQLELIDAECLFKGTVDECFIHPRDIFRFAYLKNASRLILCHSHPSGSCEPSKEDLAITKQLIKAAKILKVNIDDHIILTKKDYYSFRLNGHI